ncbi:MAG: ATP synthase F1 subunit delta [Candidatus Latescibacterota bacterium]
MATEQHTARRYARALIEMGKDRGKVAEMREELLGLGALFGGKEPLGVWFNSPLIPLAAKKQSIESLSERGNMPGWMRGLMNLLVVKHRCFLVPEIVEQYRLMADDVLGRVRVSVSTAREMDRETKRLLEEQLRARWGEQIDVKTHVDEKLLGGIVVEAQGMVMDGSLKGQLGRMRAQLGGAD